jgi:hypothetical protein
MLAPLLHLGHANRLVDDLAEERMAELLAALATVHARIATALATVPGPDTAGCESQSDVAAKPGDQADGGTCHGHDPDRRTRALREGQRGKNRGADLEARHESLRWEGMVPSIDDEVIPSRLADCHRAQPAGAGT